MSRELSNRTTSQNSPAGVFVEWYASGTFSKKVPWAWEHWRLAACLVVVSLGKRLEQTVCLIQLTRWLQDLLCFQVRHGP